LARAWLPAAVRTPALILARGRRRGNGLLARGRGLLARGRRRASALDVHRLDTAGEHRALDRLSDAAARRGGRIVAPTAFAP
jgi:hypothetical protein